MTLQDLVTERRLLASLFTEPHVLAAADALETADFTDYRHWIVFSAIRQLQSEGADVSVEEVDRVLEIRDAKYGSFLRDKGGAAFMAELVLECPPYNHEPILWEYDMQWLKTCRRRRDALEAA